MLTVHRELIKRFPSDAGRSCMYGAFALAELPRDHSFEAIVAAGDFAIFTPARNGGSVAFHGFRGSTELGTESHYCVESEGRIIDVSPFLLQSTTQTQIVQPPAIYWLANEPLPRYLRYVTRMRVSKKAAFSAVPEQCSVFLEYQNLYALSINSLLMIVLL